MGSSPRVGLSMVELEENGYFEDVCLLKRNNWGAFSRTVAIGSKDKHV